MADYGNPLNWKNLRDYHSFLQQSCYVDEDSEELVLFGALRTVTIDGIEVDPDEWQIVGTAKELPRLWIYFNERIVTNLGTGEDGAIVWGCQLSDLNLDNQSRRNVFVDFVNAYDTNVLSIDLCNLGVAAYALWCCSALTRCALPAATTLGDYALRDDTALEELTLGDGLKSIGVGSLYDCTALKSLTLPATLTKIGTAGLYNCTSMTELTCHATTPPTLGNVNALGNLTSLTALRVPSASVSAYKAASGWKNYADIITSI